MPLKDTDSTSMVEIHPRVCMDVAGHYVLENKEYLKDLMSKTSVTFPQYNQLEERLAIKQMKQC